MLQSALLAESEAEPAQSQAFVRRVPTSLHSLALRALAIGQQTGRRQTRRPYASRLNVWASPFPCKNGIVRRAGKSIKQMLLRGHQMTAGDLQRDNLR